MMRLSVTLTALCLVIAAASGCTGHRATEPVGRASPARHGTQASTTLTPLKPSLPAWVTTGTNNCGNPYAINATTIHGTIPLLDCPGQAGLTPTPTVRVAVGGEVTISGVTPAMLTVRPSTFVSVHGTSYIATRAGTTTVTIDHYPFCSTTTSITSCILAIVAS